MIGFSFLFDAIIFYQIFKACQPLSEKNNGMPAFIGITSLEKDFGRYVHDFDIDFLNRLIDR